MLTADIENRGLVLDPRTKLAVMLTLVVFALGGAGSDLFAVRCATVVLSVLPTALLVTAKQLRKALLLENGVIRRDFSGLEFFALPQSQLHGMGLRAASAHTNYLGLGTGLLQIADFQAAETVTLRHFCYSYGKHAALQIEELALPTGAVIAVVGHNGAGKSTLTKALCGLLKGFRGQVHIGGRRLKPRDLQRLSYMVMQDVNHQLFAETVVEEVMLGAEESDQARALALLEQLDILACRERHPMSLSGGQKQRTAIASALLAGKSLLVFDEPTSGLDFRSMESTAALLSSLRGKCTVLIVTHDMELIERCCTHVLHIENGRI